MRGVMQDLTNMHFGRLKVMWPVGRKYGQVVWLCRCIDGNSVLVNSQALVRGETKSCGCWKREQLRKISRKHGMYGTPENRAYHAAKNRCTNKKDPNYPEWGGRGIEFRFASFVDFYEAIGKRPGSAYTLDRINNNGHYEKGNIRWATRRQQALNRRPKRIH